MWPVMPIFELVQEMMFVNMCVKFHDNRLKNEVCRAVTRFQGGKSPLLGGGGGYMWSVMPMFKLVQERIFLNMCVKFRDNRLRSEVCRVVTPFQYERMYVPTGRSLYIMQGYN